jgi:aldose 1-epimerase
MTEILRLVSGAQRVDLVPAIGGSIAAFFTETEAGRIDWLRPMSDTARRAGDVLGAACFPLIPFSNRIRGGRFVFAGRAVRMVHPYANAEHGHGWLAPWQVAEATATRARLVFDRAASTDWPFAYRATQEIALHPDRLDVEIAIRNTGAIPMPAGLGLHPYFPRTTRTTLTARVAAIWETDADILPTALVPVAAPRDPGIGLAVDRLALDNVFTGWDGGAGIVWPEHGARLSMRARAPLGFLVVYTPPGEPYFCAEPVSNATDAFNLAAAGRGDTGMRVLAPGETIAASVAFAPERARG